MTVEQKTVHVRIEGRVQRLGYRAWTQWNAKELGLEGWVRNRTDGCVDALFAGPAAAVDQMLERAKSGPADAKVSRIDIIQEGGATPDGFTVLPTE